MSFWRLRVISSNPIDCFMQTTSNRIDEEVCKVLNELGASVHYSVGVILFNTEEDLIVFRLKVGI